MAISREELARVNKSIDHWTTYFDSIQNKENLPQLEQSIPALQECLYSLHSLDLNSPPITPLALMEMSILCEPSIGVYSQSYSSQKLPLSSGSYSAILFTEVLSSYKLFAQKDLLEAGGLLSHKKSSTSSLRSKASSELTIGPHDRNHPQPSPEIAERQLRRARSFPPLRSGNINITGFSELDMTSQNRVAAFPHQNFLVRGVRDVLNVDVYLYRIHGELVLKSFKDENARGSRLSSVIIENPSKRMSSGSRRLSAQFQPQNIESQMADYALPAISVVAKAASFERLVDMLVLGVEDFSSLAISADPSNMQRFASSPPLHMDMDIYTATFLSTYKNFATPEVLFDALRRRFLGAGAASVSLAKNDAKDLKQYPEWNRELEEGDKIDIVSMAKIQIGILEACNVWTTDYFADLLSELHLRESFMEFLQVVDNEVQSWKAQAETDDSLGGYADTIESLSRRLRKAIIRRSYRPLEYSPWPSVPSAGASPIQLRFPDSSPESINSFCNAIDDVVAIIFKQIKLRDWLTVYEVFATQTIDPLKMFSARNLTIASEDEVMIQDIYSFCATLHSYQNDELMVSLLPKPIKRLYAFRMNFVSWVTMQISDPSIKRSTRIRRMRTLLNTIAICRRRMSIIEFGAANQYSRPDSGEQEMIIPSLIESAIGAAAVRPESRLYTAAWIHAARDATGNPDISSIATLEEIIPNLPPVADENLNRYSNSTISDPVEPLTPCMGWIFERIFEIVCHVPNMAVENPSMINFDKQRYIYNLLSNVVDLESRQGAAIIEESPVAALITSDLSTGRFDKKQIKETVVREAKDLKISSKIPRAFHVLVSQELDKVRRDCRQRDALDRQSREQARASSSSAYRHSISHHSVNGKMTSPLLPDRKPKHRLGGLLRAVRPISMAFSNTSTSSSSLPDRSVPATELPDAFSSSEGSVRGNNKPVLNVNLAYAITTIPSEMQGQGVFKIICDDGADYLLQATNADELDDWVKLCSIARATALEKAGKTPVVGGESKIEAPSETKVFGIPIEELCARENKLVPSVVQILLDEIENRGECRSEYNMIESRY